jgi:methylated-DNA-[protein]-cysteine S-methyltransferase
MKAIHEDETLLVFPSRIGWIAVRCGATAARQLTFGHASAAAATKAIGGELTPARKPLPWQSEVIKLLQAYAEGDPVDLTQIPIDFGRVTRFRARVLNLCHKIPYGVTFTYGELAAKAGAVGAARAIGTCMARNPLPLIVPCHRVTRAGGVIGPYSAAEGTKTKSRLLAMEATQTAASRA